ncbi:MAG: putative addiction module antidote protein [Elusimicrobia bacterium]|nr:putative addiction module antidote protein [Elusimicrobiota bacterium]
MKKRAPGVSHEKEQLREFRADPKLAAAYLNSAIQVAFDENEPELLLIALAAVARAYGMTHVAKEADLKRESLHRMLSKRGNPEWNSMFRVLKALHLRPRLESTGPAIA